MNNWFLTITSMRSGYSVTSIMANDFNHAMIEVETYMSYNYDLDIVGYSSDSTGGKGTILHGEKSTDFVSSDDSVWVYRNERRGIFASLLPDIHHNR